VESRHSIATKVFGQLTVATIIIIIISLLVIDRLSQSVQNEENVRQTTNISNLAKSVLAPVIIHNDQESVQNLLKRIEDFPQVLSARLINADNIIIASGDEDEVGKVTSESLVKSAFRLQQAVNVIEADESIKVATLIDDIRGVSANNQQSKLVLLITMNMETEEKTLASFRKLITIESIFMYTALSLLTMILLYRLIIRPFRRFIFATRRIAEGDFETRLPHGEDNELDEFASRFNQMMDEIKRKNDQVTQSQNVLMESELKFRSITDSAFDPIIMVDSDGDISYWNPSAKSVFGYRSEDVIGCQVVEILAPPQHKFVYQQILEELMKGGRREDINKPIELKVKKKDETIISVEVTISPVIIDGQWNAVGIIRDVSDRKLAEEELKESRQRLELAMITMNAGLWDWNVQQKKIHFNSRYSSMLGYEEGEIENDTSHRVKLVHPDDQPHMQETLADVLAGKLSEYRLEQRYRKKTGEWIWVLCLGKVVERDKDGIPVRLIGTHIDIHKSKMAEIGVKQYQDNLEQMVYERTRKLEITHAELINKAIEAGRSQLSAMVLHNIGNAITPAKVKIEEMKSDSLLKVIDYLEKCYGELTAHAENLTEYITNDQRGKEVFKFMGELISKLKDRRDKQQVNIDKIDKAISYISEILALQQAYAVHDTDARQQVNLNLLLEDALHMQSSALEKRHIRIIKHLAPNLPKLVINKNRLIQVIINIIKNGYEAIDEFNTESTHSISISTFLEQEQIGFEISDTGIGIDSGQIASIFEFGKSKKGSSGIGLYYCKVFVEQNDGEMVFTSEGRERGATVRVLFPFK